MSPIPRKQHTIVLTDIVHEAASGDAAASKPEPKLSLPSVAASLAERLRRNRFVAAAGLCTVVLLSFTLLRDDAESTASTELSAVQRLSAESEQLRARIGELEAELTQMKAASEKPAVPPADAAPDQDNAPITKRVFIPDGSERNDPFYGPKDSPVIAMVFSDVQCRICREFHESTLPKIRAEYADTNKVKLIYRDFPLAGNENAVRAASFAHCAGEQGAYWRAFELLNRNSQTVNEGDFSPLLRKLKDLDQAALAVCLRSKRYETEIAKDSAQGTALGAKGAPSMFVGTRNGNIYSGVFIRGAQPYAVIKQELDRALFSAPQPER